jgi:hypothetical protein
METYCSWHIAHGPERWNQGVWGPGTSVAIIQVLVAQSVYDVNSDGHYYLILQLICAYVMQVTVYSVRKFNIPHKAQNIRATPNISKGQGSKQTYFFN